MFGGWKTDFYMGYNVPSQYALFNRRGDPTKFVLNIPFGTNFDDLVVDEMVVRVILPEGLVLCVIIFHPYLTARVQARRTSTGIPRSLTLSRLTALLGAPTWTLSVGRCWNCARRSRTRRICSLDRLLTPLQRR